MAGVPEPLILLHGFTQTGRGWDEVVCHLDRERYRPLAPDLRGHGAAGPRRPADFDACVRDIASLAAGSFALAGYSMGGRLALHVAFAHPALVERLVLVSSTAGIADDAARATRRLEDERRADEIERDGVEAFLERWLALPLFAGLPPDAAGLDERRANTTAGLASSLRLAGAGAQASLGDRLGTLTMPVLLVAGALDTKFVGIAEQMAAAIPTATLAIVAGAGHVVHVERPDKFVGLLRHWLSEHN